MKRIVFIILVILLISITFAFGINMKKSHFSKDVIINSKKDYRLTYGKLAYVSDYVEIENGYLVDKKIKYDKLGDIKVKYEVLDNKKNKKEMSITIKVVDDTPPVTMLRNELTIEKNTVTDLSSKLICADNYDKNPECNIVGDYDLTTPGKYKLTYVLKDSSNNISSIDFTLNVINKNSISKSTETSFKETLQKHKNDKTMVGIDVSKWQGTIDWEKVKNAGVEFAMIRVGAQNGFGSDNYLDKEFISNIENALKNDIQVGLYFYSYATTKDEAISQAKWVLNEIKDYKITLPIVFDWESWSKFNNLGISLFDLTSVQEEFLKVIEDAGYIGARYGSKNYLTNMWLDSEYKTWLAHYTDNTNYEGKYFMWQLCNNGIIDGINGYVDIDVMYIN